MRSGSKAIEYLLYAAALANAKQTLEVKWRHYQAQQPSRSERRVLDDGEALSKTQALREISACMHVLRSLPPGSIQFVTT
jgi:hypothetical protein